MFGLNMFSSSKSPPANISMFSQLFGLSIDRNMWMFKHRTGCEVRCTALVKFFFSIYCITSIAARYFQMPDLWSIMMCPEYVHSVEMGRSSTETSRGTDASVAQMAVSSLGPWASRAGPHTREQHPKDTWTMPRWHLRLTYADICMFRVDSIAYCVGITSNVTTLKECWQWTHIDSQTAFQLPRWADYGELSQSNVCISHYLYGCFSIRSNFDEADTPEHR